MLLRAAQSAEAARGSMHVLRPAPALATPRANTSRFTRIFSDFLLQRFQGIFNSVCRYNSIHHDCTEEAFHRTRSF
ncbi:hypothetical protein A2U01_0057238 [Trifolium medium]|uniref:Uncharacterized protein n=1 Tax=Trifolium medium TaxID=97028 RepID=A0A392RJL1_9FABA|nr:hypothetical protein [Trifolium medium]